MYLIKQKSESQEGGPGPNVEEDVLTPYSLLF